MKYAIAGLLCAGLLTACATAPDEVEANYVPPVTYSGLSCDDLQSELVHVSDQVRKVTGQQRAKARNDKLAVGGAIIFWPSLFFLASGDKENKLADLKGTYDALVLSAKQKKCDFAKELRVS